MPLTEPEILGIGWQFPFYISGRRGGPEDIGGVSIDEGRILVRQSIMQILGTRIGERVMRRDFGSRIYDLVFEPNDPLIDVQVEHYVRVAIERWEPRVLVGPVTINRDQRLEGVLLIEVTYEIIQFATIDSLVFPWYAFPKDRTQYEQQARIG